MTTKADAEREIQNNAQMIYSWLKAMKTPRDATATLMMAQAALVWSQRPADAAAVRALMVQYTDGVVALWRAQVDARAKEVINAQQSPVVDEGVAPRDSERTNGIS